eukprot:CAMPEP_0183727380 /NCGR_PEP_ID=MMETSP0737-20130205/25591_1 /TAXON_ID=385413 /ORGANISM="Thalassiosira miniscula, Strain CCMP1093" /LENGTH=193 /DNA_ID=CAMNT_0025959007 /DNA_START=129 /DNA_END=710 /DNA_ORIENTATION=+
MDLKVLLSLAAIAGASATDLRRNLRTNDEVRRLQSSIACLMGGSDFTDCCPSALESDGVCSILWCVDIEEMAIRDGCHCTQIHRSCRQLAPLAFLVPGLTDMCSEVNDCCVYQDTSNDDFNTCMSNAISVGDMQIPDIEALDSLVPGGLPEFLTGDSESTESSIVTAIIENPDYVEDTFVYDSDGDMSMDFRF